MGWEQNWISSHYLNKTSYHSIDDIDSDIDRNNNIIEVIKKRLLAFAVASPSEIINTSEDVEHLEDIIYVLENDLEELEELLYRNFLLEDFKNSWNTRSGDFTKNPDIKEAFKSFAKEHMLSEIEYQKSLKEEENE